MIERVRKYHKFKDLSGKTHTVTIAQLTVMREMEIVNGFLVHNVWPGDKHWRQNLYFNGFTKGIPIRTTTIAPLLSKGVLRLLEEHHESIVYPYNVYVLSEFGKEVIEKFKRVPEQ